MRSKTFIKRGIIAIITLLSYSCEDFVEVKAPENKLVREEVFQSEETIISAMTGIYNQLFMAAFSNGHRSSVTVLSGLSADEIQNINTTNLTRMEFEQNELLPDNPENLNLWSSAFNIIYMTNSFLEGLADSEGLNAEMQSQLEGEVRFVRAFTYFYLVNLYGGVPLLLTTSYQDNQLASRDSESAVYQQILEDLQVARELLSPDYLTGERTQVNQYAASALLARVNLYLEDWEQAESYSTQVIQETSSYEIQENLDNVFLANSKEAIWQISPIGDGELSTHTWEGNIFIIHPIFSFLASLKLNDEFVSVFGNSDKRLSNWIRFHSGKQVYYAYKYKIRNSSDFPIEEYSMVLRLAEQYLIRAEARAKKGDLFGAIDDLDVIRGRAGLELLSEVNPTISQEELLEEIMLERRRELFAEWGHRWLDLKRTGSANEVLGSDNPFWENTDVLYPIPSEERRKNLNLSQNEGY